MAKRNTSTESSVPVSGKATKATATAIPSVFSGVPAWWLLGAIVAIFIASKVAYHGSLDNNFVDWDDQLYVTENPMVLQAGKPGTPPVWGTPVALNYHPLTMKSLIMNARQSTVKNGLPDPQPFISMNVNLHAVNGILVFLMIWLLTQGNFFAALFTALIFALHPMHVESVAWISERKDVLYVFFFLLAATAYIRYMDTRNIAWLAGALGLFVLSCLSKAMAVSLVPVLFLMDYWRHRDLKSAGIWLEKLPFIAVALFFGLMAVDIQGGGNFHGFLSGIEGVKSATDANDRFSLINRFMLSAYGMMQYIFKFFVPANLSPFYPYPAELINKTALPAIFPASLGLFVVLAGLAVKVRLSMRYAFFGFAFYFFTVALVSQFFAVGLVVMADRYTYLPYIGLALATIMGIQHLTKNNTTFRTGAYIILGLYCAFMLVRTQKQVEIWQNTETLWTSALEQYPTEGQVLANLGNHYGKTGQIEKAASCFERALQQNVRNASVYEGFGNVYGARGDHQKAAEMFGEAIKIDPKKGNFYFNRGTAYLNFDPAKSIADFTSALELMPPAHHPAALSKRALANIKTQNYQAAVNDYTAAITAGSKLPNDYYDRGVAKLNLNDKAGAISDMEMALRLDPNFALARNALNVIKTQ